MPVHVHVYMCICSLSLVYMYMYMYMYLLHRLFIEKGRMSLADIDCYIHVHVAGGGEVSKE